MTTDYVIFICREMLITGIYILLPVLGTAMVIGLLISLFQAVTQINEMTMTFVPKITVVGGMIFILLPWLMDLMMDFTIEVFHQMIIATQ
ncbi:MAG TPA: flagellar biosynthetic protein FliQ [Calditrichia bacterium]|nr:flagellar biosynthetic protein FliQ [Calditrichota bacterium]HQU70656.1 flagellar biosynthetic protein FliQ [Calditrichia bacterium]HQV30398.1 flagellar biosynthetic protein FliQ [Calditrichia bacterium]